jgi:hypothetical protein
MFPLLLLLFAARVEIYEDWRPWATATEAIDSELISSLEKRGVSLRRWDRKINDDTSLFIFSNLGVHLKNFDLGKIPKEKLILFRWEPPTVQSEIWDPKIENLFHKIYTWNDERVDNIRFFKFHLPYSFPKIPDSLPFEERKFLTLIASRLSSKHPNQLYSEREKLIRFFEKRPKVEFDLYGRNWKKRKFHSWRGTIPAPDKLDVLKKYRFAFAYENSRESGYITEKLWDCFAVGVVPIYWGAPNIEDYVPANCFIDRRKFANDADLLVFLAKMTKEEWSAYIQNAASFLQSERAAKFSVESYIQVFTEAAVSK